MKALLQDRYGTVDDLRIGEAPEPEIAADEVLVRVRATAVHADMWHVLVARPYFMRIMGGGFRRPRCAIPGTDAAGVVEAVGADVGSMGTFLKLFLRSPFSSQLHLTRAGATKQPMCEIAELAAVGKVTTIIDRVYPLEEAPDAMRRLMSGDACGKLVVRIG